MPPFSARLCTSLRSHRALPGYSAALPGCAEAYSARLCTSLARSRAAWLAAPIISSPVSSTWQSFLHGRGGAGRSHERAPAAGHFAKPVARLCQDKLPSKLSLYPAYAWPHSRPALPEAHAQRRHVGLLDVVPLGPQLPVVGVHPVHLDLRRDGGKQGQRPRIALYFPTPS